MNSKDLMPGLDMGTYVPPAEQSKLLVDPMTSRLHESLDREKAGVQEMMRSLDSRTKAAMSRSVPYRMTR